MTKDLNKTETKRAPAAASATLTTTFADQVVDQQPQRSEKGSGDGPNRIQILEYRLLGALHRTDGPASVTKFYYKGFVTDEKYYVAGMRHRIDGPALIERHYPSGVITREEYYVGDKLHRINGPAYIRRDPTTGLVTDEGYFVGGHHHRIDGPAYIRRHPVTGVIFLEEYLIDGKFHRDDGPAQITRNEVSGDVIRETFYLKGKKQRSETLPPSPARDLQKRELRADEPSLHVAEIACHVFESMTGMPMAYPRHRALIRDAERLLRGETKLQALRARTARPKKLASRPATPK